MTTKTLLISTLSALVAAVGILSAQPPDFAVYPGDQESRLAERHDERLARITDYLELSEAQVGEWQEIAARHHEQAGQRRDRIASLREEFRTLAEQETPNLEQLGQTALDLHREMETMRTGRDEIMAEIETILTPEQSEKLAALKAARELGADRGHRRPRGDRDRPSRN
jgi:Spy/CpxP family protein refolding chaperone